jgi:hypothetical protein
MEIHGSMRANLTAAVSSARRLRGHPVHADTLQYWSDLLHEARRELSGSASNDDHALGELMAELQATLADRASVAVPVNSPPQASRPTPQ